MLIRCIPFSFLAFIYIALLVYAIYRAAPGSRAIRKIQESPDREVREQIPEIPFRVDAGGRSEDWAFSHFIFDREYREWPDRDLVQRIDDMRVFGSIGAALLFFLIPFLVYPEFRGLVISTLCSG